MAWQLEDMPERGRLARAAVALVSACGLDQEDKTPPALFRANHKESERRAIGRGSHVSVIALFAIRCSLFAKEPRESCEVACQDFERSARALRTSLRFLIVKAWLGSRRTASSKSAIAPSKSPLAWRAMARLLKAMAWLGLR